MTTFGFGNGKDPVAAHQHINGGGWVADTATVADTAYVGPNAKVYGIARVSGNATVSGDARVYGTALVSDNAWVYGNATVLGTAKVYGNAWVYGDARVSGNATVSGDAMVLKTPPRVSRSDGYDFIVVPCADNQCRVIAGCRYFTFDEAYEHWNKNHSNYDETVDILDYLKKRRKKSYVDSKSD
jgi:carbonic anhydrase/acetyltransferase-like protein (isoleucine patch superfamily)